MLQLILPGFEPFFGFQDSSEIIYNPEKAIDYYESRGYTFLSDWNSGIFLIGNSKNETYVPERISLPSDQILDEKELLEKLANSRSGSLERRELEGAFYFYNALTHEDMETKRYDFACSFFDLADEKRTLGKYRKNPFFS